ncbi:MAG: error-prone DNA polymerase [Deltaproteobacteria bacterium]|nr:error-prone DNA polymerase [Deltaproteobacteria bacterium]
MSHARYAELHCRSNYSFLSGASHPAELISRAAELGLAGLAITDIAGLYGIVRCYEALAAIENPPQLIYGSELPLIDGVRNDSIVLLAQDLTGYGNLCQLITIGRRRAQKGEFALHPFDLEQTGTAGLIALYAGPRSLALHALQRGDDDQAERLTARYKELFADRLYLELTRHQRPGDVARSLAVNQLARRLDLTAVATNDVHFHHRARKPLHDVLTCIRQQTTLPQAGRLLLPNAERALKPAAAMAALFADLPEVVAQTVTVAERCTFRLDSLRYSYPDQPVPAGHDLDSYLALLARRGLSQRLGGQRACTLHAQLERELKIIKQLGYAGYFLTMWEIVQFCHAQRILCQGRGSAANSLVCFATGITSVSPDQIDMLFERFLSLERDEPPDIDLDIEHDRREEVIQEVYKRYGRDKAAMVAEVIRYRTRSAIRDVGKAIGLSEQTVLRISRYCAHGFDGNEARAARAAGLDANGKTWRQLRELANQLNDFPRHLSIHVGGFVLSSGPLSALVPLENARMPDRTVIQWDKYDIETMRIFKVDLLGLGMLNVIARAFFSLQEHRNQPLSLGSIPANDRPTYQMIQRADTIGVFQIESRAQMGMLPRLKPDNFYDLVIEVALVRPGPIQGGMVHPYLRRRRGEESIDYAHPRLKPILHRTLGVPIFQEQVMRMAVEVGGYSPGEADQLRRDMGAWRHSGKMAQHQKRLYAKMLEEGIDAEFAQRIVKQIEGFGAYGFPESHAAAFAHLVYVSAYLKCHYPAEFALALVNAQPMGFYQVSSIIADAHRHSVQIRGVDIQASDWESTLESTVGAGTIRLGLHQVRGLGQAAGERIVLARGTQPYASIDDVARRASLQRPQLVKLALAGAFGCFVDRRRALWRAAALGGSGLVDNALDEPDVRFAELSASERLKMDYQYSGSFIQSHPLALLRNRLRQRGAISARDLRSARGGDAVAAAGIVIVRQRPTGPGGVVFMALEDETGLIDVVLRPAIFEAHRTLICLAEMLLIRGTLQADGGARSILAERLENLIDAPAWGVRSRDFH